MTFYGRLIYVNYCVDTRSFLLLKVSVVPQMQQLEFLYRRLVRHQMCVNVVLDLRRAHECLMSSAEDDFKFLYGSSLSFSSAATDLLIKIDISMLESETTPAAL